MRRILTWLVTPTATTSWPLASLIACVSVGLAGAARYALMPVLGVRSPFMMFIIGVALATYRGSWKAGLLAIPISGVIVVMIVDPIGGSGWDSIWANVARVSMYLTVCTVVIFLLAKLQAERNRLSQAQETLQDVNLVLERRVQHRTEELVQAHGELQAITHSVAHDVRAPLRAIIANSVLLQREYAATIDDEGLEMLERQRQNALKLSNLMDSMLEFSRINRWVPRPDEVDLTDVANGIAMDLKNRYVASPICFSIQEGMSVHADPTMMGCVLENLMENACKFSSVSGVTIKVRLKKQGEGMVLTVSDTGPGFEPEYSEKIFEPFHRLLNQPEVEGTGTGLANVRRIASLHGGTATATSKGKGKGASFRVWIPDNLAIRSA